MVLNTKTLYRSLPIPRRGACIIFFLYFLLGDHASGSAIFQPPFTDQAVQQEVSVRWLRQIIYH